MSESGNHSTEAHTAPIQITRFTKVGGILTKRISLKDGKPHSDGSACVMSNGWAEHVSLDSLHEFADFIHSLKPNEAIALGALCEDLRDRERVPVVTEKQLSSEPNST